MKSLGYDLIDGSVERGFLIFRSSEKDPDGGISFNQTEVNVNLEVAVFSKVRRFGLSANNFLPFEELEARAVLKAFDEYNARKEVK